jgi:hypothetical protein
VDGSGINALVRGSDGTIVAVRHRHDGKTNEANMALIAATLTQHAELLRYLPVLERAEADTELWERLTAGTGIATLSGYRAAIAKATQP